MSNPAISVVMPVYNGEKYLREAIESILDQTYSDFEFIILNDGSTDRTEEIILSYDDSRIVYIKNETNLQIVKTLNKGITLAKGKYIARMDADDISLPERFEEQITFMENNPEIDVCGTGYRALGESNIVFKPFEKHENIKVRLLFTSPLAHPTIMMKKEVFNSNRYSEDYDKAEDYALWIQLINNYTFANISQSLLLYRIHNEQTTIKYDTYQLASTKNSMKKYLEYLGMNVSDKDLVLHQDISLQKKVAIDKAEKWLLILISQNKKVLLFDQTILQENIFEYWKYQCFSQTDIGLKNLKNFYSSKLYLPRKLSFLQHMKLILKCFIKYSND